MFQWIMKIHQILCSKQLKTKWKNEGFPRKLISKFFFCFNFLLQLWGYFYVPLFVIHALYHNILYWKLYFSVLFYSILKKKIKATIIKGRFQDSWYKGTWYRDAWYNDAWYKDKRSKQTLGPKDTWYIGQKVQRQMVQSNTWYNRQKFQCFVKPDKRSNSWKV